MPAATVVSTNLQPYKSFLLVRISGPVTGVALSVVDTILSFGGSDWTLISRGAWQADGLDCAAAHVKETRTASWDATGTIDDVTNHLFVVTRYREYLALSSTDARTRDRVARMVEKRAGALSSLRLIPPGRLNKSFVTDRTPRTLWLSGTHRRTTVKADSKVLAGIDLRDALDPLDDQSFHMSSVRCDVDFERVPLGVSPGRSRVWAGPADVWGDFAFTARAVLERLHKVTSDDDAPLPVLAAPVNEDAKGAFDVALLPGDNFSSDPPLPGLERWQTEAFIEAVDLEVVDVDGANCSVRVRAADFELGVAELQISRAANGHVKLRVEGAAATPEAAKAFAAVKAGLRRRAWLKVRYESGHTLSDGALYSMRHRDVTFRNWLYGDFTDHDVKKEKPGDLTRIGTEDSLFCWVQKHWPSLTPNAAAAGFLACDDGSMEIADFIHVSPANAGSTGVLSLIHVKGAKSGEPGRRISVSAYEVVVGQAVKNIRSLDRLTLSQGLRDGLKHKIATQVWKDGDGCSRIDVLRALDQLGDNYERRVYVVQPHVRRSLMSDLANGQAAGEMPRLRQLQTLLVGAQNACANVGASFYVIGDGDRSSSGPAATRALPAPAASQSALAGEARPRLTDG